MINVCKVFITFGFWYKKLLRMMDLNSFFIFLPLWVLILNIEDTKYSIVACRKQHLVVKGKAKSLYRQTVGLYFIDLFPWIT